MNIERFAHPGLLWLLTVIIPLTVYYIYRTRQGGATVQVSSIPISGRDGKTFRYYLRHLPFALRMIAISLIIVALARPQNTTSGSSTLTQGIDIVLAIDVSGSMLARDFRPDRITVARETAAKFITDRPNDRIGIVVFAGESYTQAPLTTDKKTLLNLMSQVREGVIDDGTAIGNGLATAVNRLRDSDASSKVVILLTDGVNNMGQITPLTAADIAVAYGIKVYTIGVGTIGTAPYPARDIWGNISYIQVPVEIDEEVLQEISRRTGGEYFRATNNRSLAEVYDRINELETSKIETSEYVRHNELFQWFVLMALCVLMLEFLVRFTLLRRIP